MDIDVLQTLIIDDQRIFKIPKKAIHATTSQEGIKLLDSQPWDEVFLDHDLGSDSEGSGSDIVRHIVATRPLVDLFVVHSMNAPAAERMISDLVDAGYKAIRLIWTKDLIDTLLDMWAMEEKGRNPFYAGPKGSADV
jgi:hypothetical protein